MRRVVRECKSCGQEDNAEHRKGCSAPAEGNSVTYRLRIEEIDPRDEKRGKGKK